MWTVQFQPSASLLCFPRHCHGRSSHGELERTALQCFGFNPVALYPLRHWLTLGTAPCHAQPTPRPRDLAWACRWYATSMGTGTAEPLLLPFSCILVVPAAEGQQMAAMILSWSPQRHRRLPCASHRLSTSSALTVTPQRYRLHH